MTRLSENKKSIVVEKPGVNLSIRAELAFSLNKSDFRKTFKKRLVGYTDTVYSEIHVLKNGEASKDEKGSEGVTAE